MTEPSSPLDRVRRWLHSCVLDLELCPFAGPVVEQGSVRFALSPHGDRKGQLQDFLLELDRLQNSAEEDIATTLLVLEAGPADFEAFMDLVDEAQALLEAAGLEGIVQLAHFHPAYCFAGEDPADASNYTNRSPLPIIHLLRESQLSRALDAFPNPEAVPERNIATMRALGLAQLQQLWASFDH